MAVKFSTCYPRLPEGVRTPCGIVADRRDGSIQEIICPEISAESCSRLVGEWNSRNTSYPKNDTIEEDLAQFISDELKRMQV